MNVSQDSVNRAVEVADLVKELREAKDAVVVIRDHVFDTLNVPFSSVRRAHDQLIGAEKSLEAAAVALTKS